MGNTGHIQLLSRDGIDETKWDRCIETARNGLIYGYSFYLDEMHPGWEALVLNDYEAVMPLTGKKKFGISYLAQPFLTAQLGVFGANVTGQILERFLLSIPRRFRYCDIYLNHGNLFLIKDLPIYERSNYVLSLRHPYDDLRAAYRDHILRNVKRAEEAGCRLSFDVDVARVIELALFHMKEKNAETGENVRRFTRLFHHLHQRHMARNFGILSPNGKLISSAVFFYSHSRAYYILVGNHPDGRTLGASHALIDHFIREHAQQDLLLDFEGSDLRNLAFFYSSFGAREENYAALKWNRLPFWIKWLKN